MRLKKASEIVAELFSNTLLKFNYKLPKRVIDKRQLFFIVGMGRSGTTFLANILDKAPKTCVYHEARGDYIALVDAYWDISKAETYLLSYRQRLIAARIILRNCKTYGEVNSLLRYHVDILEELWDPTIFHIVRDGRDVVRSIMNREAFTPRDQNHTGRIFPRENDEYAYQWAFMGRFEKVCWYWAATNKYLLNRGLSLIRFEEIISSYEAFMNKILVPLEITVSYSTWKKEVKKPKNIGKTNEFPEYKEWSVEQKKQFANICGPTMKVLGYQM